MRLRLRRRITFNKNSKLFRTSWKVQSKLFFEHSTLHGVRYIAEKGRPFIERFMWFVCVAISAVATMIIIDSLWEKFQTNPTITGLDTDFHKWDVPFPAITICQDVPSNASLIQKYVRGQTMTDVKEEDLEMFLLKLTQLSYATLPDFKEYVDKGYVSDGTDLKELVFQLMNPCESIFVACVWKTEHYNCCDGFFPVFTEAGFCYSLNSRHYENTIPGRAELLPTFEIKYIKETDVKWSLKFDVSSEVEDLRLPIYIHNSDEIPGIDVTPQHVWEYKVDRISFSVKQTYTTEDARQLSIKQRHCIFEDEVKLAVDYMYTYTACTRQCRMETATKLCKCVPHFYPETGRFKHCTIRQMGCIVDHLDAIVAVDKCSCQLGCSNTVYEIEKLNENGDQRSLEAEFASWPMVRYKREVLFGWVDLLVSFGGIAGLFLGFSLLSGVELIYYFTIRVCCMVNMETDELKRVHDGDKLQPKPEYDLSLVPYFKRKPLPGYGLNEMVDGFYKQNVNRYHNKIIPVKPASKDRRIGFVAPFGIEFAN